MVRIGCIVAKDHLSNQRHPFTRNAAVLPGGQDLAVSHETKWTGIRYLAIESSAQPPESGSSFIGFDTISWSSGGVTLLIENYGTQGINKPTWTILADTISGVATFFGIEGCLDSEWAILDSNWGNNGNGYIGSDLRVAGGNASAAAAVEAASTEGYLHHPFYAFLSSSIFDGPLLDALIGFLCSLKKHILLKWVS